jgi:signal transduction histidine kinase
MIRVALGVAIVGVLVVVGAVLWDAAERSRPLQLQVDFGLALIVGVVAGVLVVLDLALLGALQVRRWRGRAAYLEAAQWRFMRQLDHQLKNPVGALILSMDNIGATCGDNDSLDNARQQLNLLSKLCQDMRKLGTLEQQLKAQPVDLEQVLRDVVMLVQSNHPGRNVHLRRHQPFEVAPVPVDGTLMKEAFTNVVENAVKYSPNDSDVEILLQEDDRNVEVDVSDKGLGIERDELKRVFEEYYRGKRTDGVSGSGIGLALTKRVITAHRGDIRLRSEPGKGTLVRVILPKGKRG